MFALQGFFEEQPSGPGPSRLGVPAAPASSAESGRRCPPQPLSRPAPSRRGSGAGEEKTNIGKILKAFDRGLQRPFPHTVWISQPGKLRHKPRGQVL